MFIDQVGINPDRFGDYRFSEDLDFTVLPEGPFTPDEVFPILDGVASRVHEASGLDLVEVMRPCSGQSPGSSITPRPAEE